MTFYSTHLKPHQEPVLVPERFAWGALFFGPIWLLVHRAWIPAVLALAAMVLAAALFHRPQAAALITGLAVLLGLTGHDLRRWSLERRGYLLVHVVSGRDEIDAMRHLLEHRPDLEDRYWPRPA